MGGGKKKKNGGSSTADQERSAEKAEAKVFPIRERYKTYFVKKAVRPTQR
jgi:hypothetical protein